MPGWRTASKKDRSTRIWNPSSSGMAGIRRSPMSMIYSSAAVNLTELAAEVLMDLVRLDVTRAAFQRSSDEGLKRWNGESTFR